MPLVIPLVGQIFDIVNKFTQGWLDALDFIDNSAMTYLVWLALITAISAGFLLFSAAFADWASSQAIDLTAAGNPLVHQGWDFIVGLVNISFILILVAIALSYILKIESWGMKKALPRLILIALLLNFSLLFVQMFVDIAWIVQNSIKNSFGEGMVGTLIAPLSQKLAETLGKQTGQLVAYAWAGAIPIAAAAKLIKFLSLVAGEALLGTYSQTILLIIFSLVGGFIFLVYGFLFLARIAVVWILAIIAPLAFVAYILPQTQKYFHQWLRALFQWLSFGIVAFFLMGLGVKLYSAVAPARFFAFDFGKETSWTLVEGYSKFLFLLIYLVVVLMFTKKVLPKGADAVWSAFSKAGMAAGIVGGLATLRGARQITREGFERPAGTYQALREAGMGRRDAFVEATRRTLLKTRQEFWPKRPMGAGARITRIAGATGATGILKALRDTAKAGALAGLGIKLKKKGLRKKPCEACGFGSGPNEKIGANAERCPKCSYVFISTQSTP